MTTSSRPLAVGTGASQGIGEQFARRYAHQEFRTSHRRPLGQDAAVSLPTGRQTSTRSTSLRTLQISRKQPTSTNSQI